MPELVGRRHDLAQLAATISHRAAMQRSTQQDRADVLGDTPTDRVPAGVGDQPERYVAGWSRECSSRIVITDSAGKYVDSFAIALGGDQPDGLVFAGAAWAQYPGQEWDEEPPGCWSVAVFREGIFPGGSA